MKTLPQLTGGRPDARRAFGALSVSVLGHALAVIVMAAICGPTSCPPVLPRIELAALASAGCGSGPSGPALAPEPGIAEVPPEPERPPLETIAAKPPALEPVAAPRSEVVPPKPKRLVPPAAKAKPVVKPTHDNVLSEQREVASAPTDPGPAAPGGGSGASSGPPRPSGGAEAPGSIGSPLAAGDLDKPPALVFSPKPEYPFQAKRRGIKGRLRVRLLVDKVGQVARVEIVGGENVDEFVESVRTTLARWRFKPGTRQGAPVHWVAILPIAFEQE